MRLTKKDIERANKRRRYSDGRGLFLSVSANGRKTWSFCYRFPDPSRDTVVNGKPKKGYREREISLGSIDFMPIDDARDRAVELRRLVRQGTDPMEERDRDTRHVIRQRRDGSTFQQVAERYIDMKKAEWDAGGKSEQSWRGSLSKHVYPVIGDTPVERIDRADIIDLLMPIWTKVPVTATRLLPRLDLIFEYAASEGLRTGNNPADRDSLRKSLPKASKVHKPKRHKAMTYDEVPEFVAALRKRDGVAPKALEFLILTALRTSEVIGATWEEFDEAGVWTIPAHRMKIKRTGTGEERMAHRVPLSKRALAILDTLPREDGNPHVFISRTKGGSGLSNMAMLDLLKNDMGYAGKATVHGFRSAFRTWAAEATSYPDQLAEFALAHYDDDDTVAAYRRTDLFEKRKPLMADWAAFVESKASA
ncbi:integrase arm-type DNA-binding domain-containing protein [Sphingomonas sp.]|uniref:tyrosine-type recombinase/integrase n=1 Tax=Sphingomonas sp. TaxID=28214 RepID=UPI0017E32C60|nr:integrase arm-type DNA-binding domain-containing protein [Sphingomonas sp.]MBA3511836.1 integrase arm-type DNA-binding domain-containing protein [Sphingomonas sp.]